MHKITLTVEKKGYFKAERKKCPNCKADWYFLFEDDKFHVVEGFASNGLYGLPKDVVQCKVCGYSYKFEISPQK